MAVYILKTNWKQIKNFSPQRSIFHHCTPCANEYDFVVKQESADEDQRYNHLHFVIYLKTNIIFRFILHALNVQNLTHIPGAYYTSLTARNAITFYFQHVPRAVLREVYRNYFLDFVMFNYTISEFVEGEISRWQRYEEIIFIY